MGGKVVFASARSGTGVSTLARAFAVEAAHSLDTKIIDLDQGAGATWQWGQRRADHGVTPIVPVVSVTRASMHVAPCSELLVIDAPASLNGAEDWSDLRPFLMIVATRESLDELDRTMQFLRGLTESGLCKQRLAVALCRIHCSSEAMLARERLMAAGYTVLQGELRQSNSFQKLQETGRAVTESPVANLAQEAYALVKSIQEAFVLADDP